MKDSDLEKVLSRRLEDETRKLQKQLDELGRKSGKSPEELLERRPYPKVQPKFRNPENPAETWSGRGKMPRWLVELIESGRNRDEFKVR
jgi:DNA-binding protein H-NS